MVVLETLLSLDQKLPWSEPSLSSDKAHSRAFSVQSRSKLVHEVLEVRLDGDILDTDLVTSASRLVQTGWT